MHPLPKSLKKNVTPFQKHPSQSLVSTFQTHVPSPRHASPTSQPSCVCGKNCLLFEPSREARRTGTANANSPH